MRFFYLFTFGLVLIISFSGLVRGDEEADSKKKSGSKKLQIGVKKRVEDCKMRSRRGDSLQMHYTVRERERERVVQESHLLLLLD